MKNQPIVLDFMMGLLCVLLVLSVVGIFFGLSDALSAWSAMRMNEIWKEKEEDESNS